MHRRGPWWQESVRRWSTRLAVSAWSGGTRPPPLLASSPKSISFCRGAQWLPPHVHRNHQEHFRVESGTVELRVGRLRERVASGGIRSVTHGTPHAMGQAGKDEAHVVERLTPAIRREDFFETFWGIAREGKATPAGMPRNRLQLALLITPSGGRSLLLQERVGHPPAFHSAGSPG